MWYRWYLGELVLFFVVLRFVTGVSGLRETERRVPTGVRGREGLGWCYILTTHTAHSRQQHSGGHEHRVREQQSLSTCSLAL